ncbi:protein-S-isoprenylcysteine O-methyltransferase isoform X1 [Frankliniella occidentalis]|uniref:Protein-S-isoprenylcysteine O-methyltransferase n=2 Tax=Frankliniella occidentalis TaxID=133901 RepID=A0A6J1T1V4_FRAOC|nr:protein-S-isoprenylcysteine O-methyltransferase isoform X1 [Frankliniella occidentalis]
MAVHQHTFLSLNCFLMGASSCLALLFVRTFLHIAALMPAFLCIDYLYLKSFLVDEEYRVGVRATLLGLVFSIGVVLVDLGSSALKPMGIYTCFLSMFHFTEFLAIAVTNPKSLSVRSFVLDNGLEYKVAAIACWIEFFVELYLFPGLKTMWYFSVLGFVMCFSGEFLRKLAMWTASSNFNHEVQSVHADGHVLVTHGVYQYMRHPSYVGWFIWSIGSQVLLINPICIVGYAIVSWSFFRERIFYEEITLLNFFGAEYHDYQQKTGTGLPFIRGYILDEDHST